MGVKGILIGCFLLCASVFIIASSAIGVECGNSNSAAYKKAKSSNFSFLIFLLVMGVMCVFCSMAALYVGATTSV
jgi:hypothetical protein